MHHRQQGTQDDQNEKAIGFEEYEEIFQYFGVLSANVVKKISSQAEQEKLKRILAEIKIIFDSLKNKKQLSPLALMNWMDVFAELDKEDGNPQANLLTKAGSRLSWLAKAGDTEMTVAYLVLNLFGLVITCFGVAGSVGCLTEPTSAASSGIASGWNGGDTLSGFLVGLHQINQGEYGLGFANIFSSAQLITFTTLHDIASFHSIPNMSASIACSLMGFSFAFGMFMSCGMELYEIKKCDERIRDLQTELAIVEKDLKLNLHDDNLIKKRDTLQKTIYIEQAQRENHKRSAKSWALCALAMTAVAVFTYITLSGLSFGALPAATLVAAAAAFVSSLVRAWWVSRKNHVDHVKAALSTKSGDSMRKRINDAVAQRPFGLDFDRLIPIKTKGIFKEQISLKSYLEKLIVEDSNKLEKILDAIKSGNRNNFIAALKSHQNSFLIGGFGNSTGFQIYTLLNSHSSSKPRDSQDLSANIISVG